MTEVVQWDNFEHMIALRRFRSVSCALLLTTTLVAAPQAGAFHLLSPSGIDVSNHQHSTGTGVDWSRVAADGQRYAFIKATEGTAYVNEHFLTDVHAAHAAGLVVGTYHYARPSRDARTQAAHYATALAALPQNSLPPVLDIEVDEGLGERELQRWVRDFLTEIEALTGRQPMVYTYRYFWAEHLGNTTEFSNYPLWLAAYQNDPPAPVGGWSHLSFWQRSDAGRVAGVSGPVDLNLFNGTEPELHQFVAGNHVNLGAVIAEGFRIPDDAGNLADLEVLGADNSALANIILAVAAGVVAVPVIVEVAEQLGFDASVAGPLAGLIAEQIESGQLPVEDLERMAATGDYTIGDLLILLDNVDLGGVELPAP